LATFGSGLVGALAVAHAIQRCRARRAHLDD
jgi:hypothetical protein